MPTDEEVVETASEAAEGLVFSRYKSSKIEDLDVTVLIADATNGRGPVDVGSMLLLTTLGARQGDELTARISGPDAERALAALRAWADEGHGR